MDAVMIEQIRCQIRRLEAQDRQLCVEIEQCRDAQVRLAEARNYYNYRSADFESMISGKLATAATIADSFTVKVAQGHADRMTQRFGCAGASRPREDFSQINLKLANAEAKEERLEHAKRAEVSQIRTEIHYLRQKLNALMSEVAS